MVLFLFVVMLLKRRARTPMEPARLRSRRRALASAALLAWHGRRAGLGPQRDTAIGRLPASARVSGRSPRSAGSCSGEYALAFEATSILILIAMVGAIALAGARTSHP